MTCAEGSCSPKSVVQAVKAICALAGGVETLHVTHTLNAFTQACTGQVGTCNISFIFNAVFAYWCLF